MKSFLDDGVLDIIESKINLLDEVGVWRFSQEVITTACEQGIDEEAYVAYTLSLFLMNIFNDDVDAILNRLAYEGFHKWNTLDEWNEYIGRLPIDCYCIDLEHVFSIMEDEFGGLVCSKDEEGNTKTVPHKKFEELFDFSCNYYYDASHTCNMPLIDGDVQIRFIPKERWNDLYVAVWFENAPRVSGLHFLYIYPTKTQLRHKGETLQYMTISDYVRYVNKTSNGKEDATTHTVHTALPQEIVKEYGLPIYEGRI